ncbi:MAG: ABC transporter permease [Dehalococcoidia bacterium]
MTSVYAATAGGRQAGFQADLRAIYIIWYRDVLRFSRDRARIVASLGQPLLFLIVFGGGLSASLGVGVKQQLGDVSYVRFLYPGIVSMAVLFTSIFSAISIVWDREFGFLRELLVAPISRAAVVLGKALGGSTIAMVQGAILLILAPFLHVSLDPFLVLKLLALMFLLAFALTSMGILVASRLQTMESFQMIINFFIMPMFFLSSAFFPLQNLPRWMGVLTRMDPVGYGVDPMRRVLLGSKLAPGIQIGNRHLGTAEDVAVLVVFAALMMFLAMRSFERQE